MASNENDALEARVPEYEYAYGKHNTGDEHYFGIGSTTPPKDHTGLIAGVLILMISICGVLSCLSMMNIDLFGDMAQQVSEPELGVQVSFTPSNQELPSGLEEAQGDSLTPESTQPGLIPGEGGMELHISQIPSPNSVQTDPPSGTDETQSGQATEPSEEKSAALSWQEVYEKVIPSVVSVVCSGNYASSSGTGVIMDTRGYIITNAHVVEDARSIQVILSDGRTVEGVCVGMDAVSDLAVLYIQAEELTAAEFGDSEALRVGDEVVAIGDPLGVELRGTMTDGIISAINRDLEVNGRTMSLLQTTAALNSGNSGGPLVNCYGQVVGINTMKIGDYASSSGVEGLGFAIPMTTVKNVVEQLARQGYVSGRPDLGMEGQMLSLFYQHYYRLPSGMIILELDESSDAAALGVREGDILLYVDGVRITDLEVYGQVVNGLEVGQTVSIMVYRSGQEYELNVTVGEDLG